MLELIGKQAKAAEETIRGLTSEIKDAVLYDAADALEARADEILEANAQDMKNGEAKGLTKALLDRLLLTKERIAGIADGIRNVAELPDPIGEKTNLPERPNGLKISRVRTPIGVIGVIYEARPNVTADVFALCFKTGNVTILRGGSDAALSNAAITEVLRDVLASHDLPKDAVQLIKDTSRETATAFMKMNEYLDLLIPRGGAGLIKTVVRESTVPVIETGSGNCHIYVDEGADIPMAVRIIENAKTQRIGVCNAAESLVVHEAELARLLPPLEEVLSAYPVELRADEKAAAYLKTYTKAEEEDWGREYLDYILSIKTVSSCEEAIRHINRYSTGHSEAILTNNEEHAQAFLKEIDSACVYVNASTRFTDGFEFGFGAEIGISTQKLHARGPMGLYALTSEKYTIRGNGQTRG